MYSWPMQEAVPESVNMLFFLLLFFAGCARCDASAEATVASVDVTAAAGSAAATVEASKATGCAATVLLSAVGANMAFTNSCFGAVCATVLTLAFIYAVPLASTLQSQSSQRSAK